MNRFESDNRTPAWFRALGASLLLHAVLVGLLLVAHARQALPELAVDPAPVVRSLVLVSENPQRRQAPIEMAEPEPAPMTEPVELSELPLTVVPEQEAADSESSPVQVAKELASVDDVPFDSRIEAQVEAPLEPFVDSPSINTEPLVVELPGTATQTVEGGDVPVEAFSPDGVRTMVNAYVRDRRPLQTEQWISACLRYNKEHGTRECPGQQQQDYSGNRAVRDVARAAFAGVLRPQQQWRALKSITAQSALLEPLLKGNAVLARLARDDYYLNSEYTAYLKGNFNFQIQDFVDESLSSHSFGGNGNSAFIPDMLQAVCNPQPCIWEYTGFSITRPEPEPEAEGAPAVFRIRPSLFGTPR